MFDPPCHLEKRACPDICRAVGASRGPILWVGPLHELVGWLLGRIPLNHSPPANITVDASAVSDGQCGIADEVLRPQYLHMKSPLRAYFEVCIDVLPIVPKFTLQIVGVE